MWSLNAIDETSKIQLFQSSIFSISGCWNTRSRKIVKWVSFCLSGVRSTFSFHSKQQRSYFPEVSRLIKQVSKLHISEIFKEFSCLLAKTSSIDSNRRPQYKLEKYKRSSVRSSNFKGIGGITKKIQRFENRVEFCPKSLFTLSLTWFHEYPSSDHSYY